MSLKKGFLLTILIFLAITGIQIYAQDCLPYLDKSGIVDVDAFKESLILDFNNSSNNNTASTQESLWLVFLLGIGGGFLALLTPCVFPMIPLTVSYFTKSNENKNQGIFHAILYGFFIFLIYILVSAPFYLLNLSPDVLNEIATNVYLNLFFFIVFVIFALSFFGFYEIQLPTGLTNKISKAESSGGILGIFFMALTLVVVSFSCTGPLVGSLLAGTLTQGPIYLTAGMAGFGLALGLPFAIFAMFPELMNKMPKSGSWLNTVKVILGFLELALALKFLSNADLVDPSVVIIKREIFILIWILLSFTLSAYLLGWYSFKKGVKETIGKGRKFLALITFLFGLALIPSFYGKDLPFIRELIAGFPPPKQYSIFAKEDKSENPNNCIYNLPCEHDLFLASCRAKKENKPILIDFTGYACVNCRKMEENVWIDERIMKLLKNEFILASLYVDDKSALPEKEQMEISYRGLNKKLKTVGNKWSFIEIANFNHSTQPLYVVLSPDLKKLLMKPVGYTPNADEYLNLLQGSISKFKN